MPREITTCAGDRSMIVSIGWTEGGADGTGAVQLATLRRPDASTNSLPDPEDPASGLYGDLDRDGINRLIRTLRKARDRAYGPDA